MYTIHVDYHTGDSFSSYDTSTVLDAEWTLEVAKENLKRIKAHNNMYQSRNNYYSISAQDKGAKLLEKAKEEPWFTDDGHGNWQYYVLLLENDNTSKKYYCN